MGKQVPVDKDEIRTRAEQLQTFGKKAEAGPDYVRIAEQQRDLGRAGTKVINALDMTYDVSVERVHRIALLHRRAMGLETFGVQEAEAFLRLFGEQLGAKLNETLINFIKEKMSK
jgi:hypothetical protein